MDSSSINASGPVHDITQLYENIEVVMGWTVEEVFGLDPEEVKALQLHWLQRRFRELRPQLKALDRLAQDVEVDEINTLDDVIPLCFPHTMLKSYSVRDLENRRFDRMNRWLGTLTVHDLSTVDVSGLETLDDWLTRLADTTPLEPFLSSGTSGKISINPKSSLEAKQFAEGVMRGHLPFRDEKGVNVWNEDVTLICPWPSRSGPHSTPKILTNAVKHIFLGNEQRLVTLGQDKMSADELWLSGRLRLAQAKGEELQLNDTERELVKKIAERQRDMSSDAQMDRFIDGAITCQAGKKVLVLTSWERLYYLAWACQKRGVRPDWNPGSIVSIGGGAKNWVSPPGSRELIDEIFPQARVEVYSMSEFSALSRLCSAGHWHAPIWGVSWILDPKTSAPLPRRGVQTGRYACFDLLAELYWAGTLSGDKLTMHWDGGCICGRKGPFAENEITRLNEAEGGDDKITCSKTPGAYENLVKFTLGDTHE